VFDERCSSCGAPLAGDQRYCLECGERRPAVSDFLRQAPPRAVSPPPAPPGVQPPVAALAAQPPSSNMVTLLAGIGVLLLAMGVGVLIGRSGSGSSRAPAAQVVTVGQGTGTSTTPGGEEAFTSDWSSGKKGFTVELQTLPEGTATSAVAAAKSAAEAKGAKAVGALKAEEFPSVGGSGYVIYSGQFTKRAEAQKALGSLKKSFPTAKVVEVSSGSGGSSSSKGASSSGPIKVPKSGPVTEQAFKKPAKLPQSSHKRASGQSYVKESSKLPNVVETP
jgi:hypothetical protein